MVNQLTLKLLQERKEGIIQRTFNLPQNIDFTNLAASLENGILTIDDAISHPSSAAHSKNRIRVHPQWSGIGVDKTVDKYVRLDMNYTLPNILILLTLM